MASTKKKATAKTAVKFRDLKSNKNPKGGAVDAFMKVKADSASPRAGWIEW
jgi:hypothetical protein